jgi:hypothetical protein
MRVLRSMLAGAAVLSLTACVDVYGSWGSEGLYDARTANGARVPAIVYERLGSGGYTVTLTGGSLRLRGDDTFRLDLDYSEYDGHSTTYYTQGISGEWSNDDGTIWLDYVDPEIGDWVSLAAIRRHDTLELTIPGAQTGASIRVTFER